MPELQYQIDTICARFTDKFVYEAIEAHAGQRAIGAEDIMPVLQEKDRSLDAASARLLVETGLKDMLQEGRLKREGLLYRLAK